MKFMKKHYVRSIFFTLFGMLLSLIIFIIASPFILIDRLSAYYKQNKSAMMPIRSKVNE
ncbi:hypothetical protein [Beduini sp.]|uniref:hypothetical protein n=2 Tax=Beduini sp. TaxID=1922300 RepID=UPI003990DA0E